MVYSPVYLGDLLIRQSLASPSIISLQLASIIICVNLVCASMRASLLLGSYQSQLLRILLRLFVYCKPSIITTFPLLLVGLMIMDWLPYNDFNASLRFCFKLVLLTKGTSNEGQFPHHLFCKGLNVGTSVEWWESFRFGFVLINYLLFNYFGFDILRRMSISWFRIDVSS